MTDLLRTGERAGLRVEMLIIKIQVIGPRASQ